MKRHHLRSLLPSAGTRAGASDGKAGPGRPRRPSLAAGAAVFLAALLLSGAPAFAAHGYESRHEYGAPRVASFRGEAFVRGSFQDDWGYAGENVILEEGDEVLTGSGGEMAVEFPGGVFMDLGPRSRARLYRLGAGLDLRVVYGSFYFVLLRNRPAYERVRVDWDHGRVTLSERGSYRVDLYRNGLARVVSARGEARVRASGGQVLLADNEEVYIEPGGFPTREASYVEGDFDDFDRRVSDEYFESGSYRLPSSANYYIPGVFTLARFGDWVYVPSLRANCWRPRGVRRGWRPYTQGRWVFTRAGWAWMPLEPWGYAPSHYGRWAFLPNVGWAWLPGNQYRPAWVRWTRVDDHIGWAVLGPGNRIVQVREGREDRTFVFVRRGDMTKGKPVKPEKPPRVKPGKLVVADFPDRFVKPEPEAKVKAPKIKKGEQENAAAAVAKVEQQTDDAQVRREERARKEAERRRLKPEKEKEKVTLEEQEEKPEKAARPPKEERVLGEKLRRRKDVAPEIVEEPVVEEPSPKPERPRKAKRREVEEGGLSPETPVQVEQRAVEEPSPKLERPRKGKKREVEEGGPSPETPAQVEQPAVEEPGEKPRGRHGKKVKPQEEVAPPVEETPPAD